MKQSEVFSLSFPFADITNINQMHPVQTIAKSIHLGQKLIK